MAEPHVVLAGAALEGAVQPLAQAIAEWLDRAFAVPLLSADIAPAEWAKGWMQQGWMQQGSFYIGPTWFYFHASKTTEEFCVLHTGCRAHECV